MMNRNSKPSTKLRPTKPRPQMTRLEVQSLSNDEVDLALRNANCVRWGNLLPTQPKDSLPYLNPRDVCVINIQDSTDPQGNPLPGVHWVAAGKLSPNRAWYFDSYGLHPPDTVVEKLGMPRRNIQYAENQIQDDDSGTCGWFSILVCGLFDLCAGDPDKITQTFKDITSIFDSPDLRDNDRILEELLISYV